MQSCRKYRGKRLAEQDNKISMPRLSRKGVPEAESISYSFFPVASVDPENGMKNLDFYT